MATKQEIGKPFTYHPKNDNYAFLVDLQGFYRKEKNQTMGLARLVDILVTNERKKQNGKLKLLG